MIKKCSKCGAESEISGITPFSECPSCGVVYTKYEKYLEKQKVAQEADKETQQKTENKTTEEQSSIQPQNSINNENDSTNQGSKKKFVNPVIVVSVVVALVISFVGYKIYLHLESLNAEREFSNFVGTISGKMIKLAIASEDVVDEINRAWRDAIFSDYNKRDFNIAIMEVRLIRANDILSIKKLSEEIAESIKNMNPPAGKENDYKRLKELYLLFNKYGNMAVAPSGSLQTYSRQNSELSVEIKSAVKELEMMK